MKDFKVYQVSGYLTNLVADASDVRKAYDEVSGSQVEFYTPISAPLEELIVDINPVQDLHGQDAPYPAGGSAQLLPTYLQDQTLNDVTLKVNSDGSVTLSGTASATTTFLAPISTWTWDGVEDCWLSGCPQGGSISTTYGLRLDTGDNTDYTVGDNGNGAKLGGLNASSYGKTLRFCIVIRPGTNTNGLTFKPMLNKGLSAQPFQPYSNICPITGWTGANVYHSDEDTSNPTVYAVSWQNDAGTVYGGTVDVVSGVLTVKMASVDLGTLTYEKITTVAPNYVFRTSIGDKASGLSNVISSQYATSDVGYGQMANYHVCGRPSDTTGLVYIRDDDYSDATSFKTAMSGVQLVYELATPTEIQLTPQEISTLIGVNNIWADTGDVSVKYRTH